MADVEKSIQDLAISVKNIQLQIKELTQQGKSAGEIFNKVKLELSNASKAAELLSSSTRDAFKPAEAKKYLSEVTKINAIFGQLISSYKSVEVAVKKNTEATLAADKSKTSSAKKLQQEYESGFQQLLDGEKRVRKLQEDVSLKNIQLSKKANVDKLQDVVNYYTNLQSEYKEDSEEYLKIEKKKLDAQIKLQKESDSIRLNSKKAAVEQAVKLEKKVESQQKVLRGKIAAQNKARTKEVLTFEKKQAERRARVLASIERKKEKQRTAEVRKGIKDREAAEKNTVKGGFAAQFSPKAIGGAIGSLTKYLGLYQLVSVAQRGLTELTIGSIKQAIAFEKALANLGAVAGATSTEVEQLGKNALAVAGKTKFTADEIVGLQTELSKLGFSADEVVKSTQSIAFAAQALGSPLGETASAVGKLRNQFGLLVEETTTISDILVTTINESALSFESFGTAMQYVGPIANNLGLNLKQTAGAMAALADAGFTASRIGTGLRGIFTELGKTSADVEKSLKSLAEQNISLSEAVDLVGKRNAAQLLTLLKNIDAVDDANDKYYQQGRALLSAAEQADTFSGQMDILNSEFQKFRIGVGQGVVNSNFFISVLGLLSTAAQRTAYGFKQLREIGIEGYGEDVKKIVDGQNSALVGAFRLLRQGDINQEQYFALTKTITRASNAGADLAGVTKIIGNAAAIAYGEGKDKLLAYLDVLKDGVDTAKQLEAVTKGQTNVTNLYGETLDDLIDKSLKGQNVNKEADVLEKQISKSISIRNTILGNSVNLSEERITTLKSEVSALQRYQEQLTNVTLSEEQLEERRKSAALNRKNKEKKESDDRIKTIKKETQEEIDNINERAQNETSISKSADERADIEMKRTATISTLYKKQSAEIRDLSKEYETQKDRIEELAEASDKLAEILTSDVIEDVTNTVKDYAAEIVKLDKLVQSDQLTQEEYNKARADQEVALRANIAAFSDLADLSPEVKAFFDQLIEDTVNADYALSNTDGVTELPKNLKEKLKDGFNEINWGEVIQEAAQTATEALSAFNDVALDNAKGEAEQQLDVIKNRYELEGEILKSQLDNQLITESQFRLKKKELRKAQVRDENEIDKALFDAQQKRDRQNATSDYLIALANIIPALITGDTEANPVTLGIKAAITGALATVSYGAELSAISQRKFFPKKFADGGVVNGPSHLEGGVPFSVQGRGGYEMEGGEFVVNKRATSMHKGLLDKINQTGRTSPTIGKMKFAEGGLVSAPVSESVDYLKAIAEATTSTAIGVSKPVRSFITDKDLRSNSTERRIRDRNDRI